MKDTWKIFKLGVYVFALPLIATAAASAHQWMTSSATLAIVPPTPVVASASSMKINALRNHTITINEDGEVQGRVATINHKSRDAHGVSDATVYFVQNGKIVEKGYSNDDGTFVVNGLKEGIYSFVAAGEFSFATCGVNVVKSDDRQSYLEIAAIAPNVKAVRDIITNELPESIRSEVRRNFAKSDRAQVLGSNRVELEGDVLRGEVVSFVSDKITKTQAHLFRGAEKVNEFSINGDGTFEVEGVEPGVYDIVVTGDQGLAAVSFEAVSGIDEEITEAYTALQESLFSNFAVALAPQCDCGAVGGCCGGGSDAIVYGDSPVRLLGDRLGGGIAGGGCCGGAGNFSGFGGCCGGGLGSRFGGGAAFGGLGGRRLLLPLLAAGIAIPLAVSSSSPTDAN